jgi:tRNA threonylcarbamoyl adenosine modification protein YeaZ
MSACTLAIETSNAQGSVAVWCDGAALFAESFTSERSHNSQLFAPLGKALEACGNRLSRIIVGLGPGSYTGARIGIAAAQGIAMTRNVAVIGLPSVISVGSMHCVLCGDARRGRFFTAEVHDGKLVGEIEQHDENGLRTLRDADQAKPWFTFDDRSPAGLGRVGLIKPNATVLARLGAALPDETVFHLEERALEPVYLAAPFVTTAKK